MRPRAEPIRTAPWRDAATDPGAFRPVTDRVMGGQSTVSMRVERVGAWLAWRLRGRVTLENNGGFAQLSSTVAEDWSRYAGLRVHVCGDGGTWWLSLRTEQVRAPWQSWRAPLTTASG